jgi:peptidoglycan/xylan/chitin deacetylase (PgdA/CDA1 family)
VAAMNPDLLVEIPADHRNEREYALSVLLGDWLRIPYSVQVIVDLAETNIRLASGSSDVVIVIPDGLFARSTEWLSATSLPAESLPVLPLPTWTGREETLPLLYATTSQPTDVVRGVGERLVLAWDLLGSLFFMLSRYEEYVARDHLDAHGRFPSGAEVMVKSGWHQWPVCDMYLHVFAGILKIAWPRLDPAPAPYKGLRIGHDVDHPSSSILWHGTQRARTVAGDLLNRHDFALALGRTRAFLPWADAVAGPDPFNTYEFLMQASEAAGVPSTFYFLTDDTAIPDGAKFDIRDPWAVRLISEIAKRGHRIGLHGSYNSHVDAGRLAHEWALLEQACRGTSPGCLRRTIRQHYLRWMPGETWRAQAEAGLREDESLGYADTIGYRAGTARSFPAYDLIRGRSLPLRVRPLHVMDGTLGYVSRDPKKAQALTIEMQRRTRVYGGEFSILWHNSFLETRPARRQYKELLVGLTG